MVLTASSTTKNTLFISTMAVIGPAGPFEKAVCKQALPTVSIMLAPIPIKNNCGSSGCTFLQYQETPTINTMKLVVALEPKHTVLAQKLKRGEVMYLV